MTISKEEVAEAADITIGLIAEAVDIATESLVSRHIDTMTALTLACTVFIELKGGTSDEVNTAAVYELFMQQARQIDTSATKKQFWEEAKKRNVELLDGMKRQAQ